MFLHMLHDWEDPPVAPPVAVPPGRLHSWEAGSDPPDDESSSGSSDSDHDDDPPDPARDFVDFALSLYFERTLTAYNLCFDALCKFVRH